MRKPILRRKELRQTPAKAKISAKDISPEITEEFLEGVPDETRIAYIQAASFKGPLPPPALFGHYEEILVGSAERILKLAEKEQSHRHGWEKDVLNAQKANTKRGQWLGFLIGLAGLTSAVICALLDKPVVATVSVVVVIAGIIASYFTNQPSPHDNDPSD